jgi:tetratricopeptide (TPR) repeat protein
VAIKAGEKPSGPPQPAFSRRIPLFVFLAPLGLVAISGAVIAAVVMRSEDALDSLEPRVGLAAPTSSAAAHASASASWSAPWSASASALASSLPVPGSASASTSALIQAEPPPPVVATAPAGELAAAKSRGSAALVPLIRKYPSDPALLEAIALAYAKEKNLKQAIEYVRQLFAIAPAAVNNPEIRPVIFRAANSTADASTPAFALMTTDMGTAGPDLMYELLIAPGVGNRPKEQAKAALLKAQKTTSPALRIALQLKTAKPCERKALFASAKAEGDARSLHYLKPLVSTTGCRSGFFSSTGADCHPCLGPRAELREAISAIEQRISSQPKD